MMCSDILDASTTHLRIMFRGHGAALRMIREPLCEIPNPAFRDRKMFKKKKVKLWG